MTLLLMRHGEPDWGLIEGPRWIGAANDLAPLTRTGEQEAAAAADLLADHPVERRPAVVVSSPMTRALQTAGIVAARLGLPVRVELDLREWLPDQTYTWTSGAQVAAAYADLLRHDGVRPPGSTATWEPLPEVRARVLAALTPHLDAQHDSPQASGRPVLAVCHEVVVRALTGHEHTAHAQIREYAAG